MELIKIIEGYNQEKQTLTEKISNDNIIARYNYEGPKAFVNDAKLRIKEIDNTLSTIQKAIIKPVDDK